MKAISKKLEVEYLKWEDNLSEMKHFCPDCKLTYEYAPGLDDYWCLQVYDDYKERDVVVPLGSYVIKLQDNPDTWVVLDPYDFEKFFEKEETKEE